MSNLQSVMDKIKENAPQMSPAQIKVADFIMDNPLDISFLNISEIAQYAGVSVATVSRFTHLIGYEGFIDFQNALTQKMKTELSLKERFRSDSKQVVGDEKGILGKRIIENLNESIRDINQNIDADDYQRAIELIFAAPDATVVGFHGSRPHAIRMSYELSKIKESVAVVDQWWGYEDYNKIERLGEDSVVILFALKRYQQALFKIQKLLLERKCRTIVFTDSSISPFIHGSACHFIFKAWRMGPYEPSLALDLLVDSIVFDVAYKDKERSQQNLDRFEQYVQINNIY